MFSLRMFACGLALMGTAFAARLLLAADEPAKAGAGIADFDKDGRIDLYVTNLYQSGPKQPQALSEYWIGIDGTPPDEALRAQLELPAGQGLVVNQVVDDSPASKAGLKQYDVLIDCQDQPLAEIGDLTKLIEEKKETLLVLRLIRGGKRIIVEITPQKRPAGQTGETCPSVSKVDDATFVRRVWLDLLGTPPDQVEIEKFSNEKQEKKREWLVNRLLRQSTVANKSCTACHAEEGQSAHQFLTPMIWDTEVIHLPHGENNFIKRYIGLPGAVIGDIDGTLTARGLPDDVSITVTVKGSKPAKITVKKGDQSWEVSPDDLQKLPEEIRGFVSPWLGRGQAGNLWWQAVADRHHDAAGWLNGRLYWSAGNNGVFQDVTTPAPANINIAPAGPEATIEKLDRQIESLTSQLGELRKAMLDLRQSLQAEKGKPAEQKK